MAGGDDFVDESGPVVGPFLLENRDKNKVEFVEKGSLRLERFFGARTLYDEGDDKVSNP